MFLYVRIRSEGKSPRKELVKPIQMQQDWPTQPHHDKASRSSSWGVVDCCDFNRGWGRGSGREGGGSSHQLNSSQAPRQKETSPVQPLYRLNILTASTPSTLQSNFSANTWAVQNQHGWVLSTTPPSDHCGL